MINAVALRLLDDERVQEVLRPVHQALGRALVVLVLEDERVRELLRSLLQPTRQPAAAAPPRDRRLNTAQMATRVRRTAAAFRALYERDDSLRALASPPPAIGAKPHLRWPEQKVLEWFREHRPEDAPEDAHAPDGEDGPELEILDLATRASLIGDPDEDEDASETRAAA